MYLCFPYADLGHRYFHTLKTCRPPLSDENPAESCTSLLNREGPSPHNAAEARLTSEAFDARGTNSKHEPSKTFIPLRLMALAKVLQTARGLAVEGRGGGLSDVNHTQGYLMPILRSL